MTQTLPFLDAATLTRLVGYRDAAQALESALRAGLDPEATSPRARVDVAAGQVLSMPAESATGVGVKLATIAPANADRGLPRIQGLYVLHDAATLTPRALVDGIALTTLRTPAVSALAAMHLASEDASRLVVFGNGPQARGHVDALASVRTISWVRVIARDPARTEKLASELRADGYDAAVGSLDDLAGADLVACATTAREPLFAADQVRPGCCVIAVGAHEPDARELGADLLAAADRVVVESHQSAASEAGDVILAVQDGVRLAPLTLTDVVGLEPGPGTSVFKSVGMGWEDLVVAELALARWEGR